MHSLGRRMVDRMVSRDSMSCNNNIAPFQARRNNSWILWLFPSDVSLHYLPVLSWLQCPLVARRAAVENRVAQMRVM